MTNTSNSYTEQIFYHYILDNQIYLDKTKSEFFSNQGLRDLFDVAKEHSLKYKEAPSKDQLFEILKIKGLSEKYNEDILAALYNSKSLLSQYDESWLTDNVGAWIQLRNLDHVMRKSIGYMKTTTVNAENASSVVEKVRNMLTTETALDFSFKMGSDFFDAASHLQTRLARKSSGYDYIDLCSGGGYASGSLIAFLGGAKSGKCCTGNTMITVRNKTTGEIKKIKYIKFYNYLNDNKHLSVNWQMLNYNITREEAIDKVNILNHVNIYSIKWQMYRYDLSLDEATEKIKKLKEINIYSVEWQMNKYNISKEEAIEKIQKILDGIAETTANTINKMSLFDRKALCCKNKEFWIKKGFSEEDSIKLAKDQISNMQNAYFINRKKNPEKYIGKDNTSIEYYLKKGFSEDEAKEKLKERQTTFSLEKCIKKYGEVEGKRIFEERQIKWQNTLKNKSQEETDEINKKKAITLESMITKWGEELGKEKYKLWKLSITNRNNYIYNGYSPISQELFFKILEFINDKENVRFAEHQGEVWAMDENNNYKIYYYDFCYRNKIIEYNGDLNHANPEMFNEDDHPNFYNKERTSKEIWDYDERKINLVKDKGYDVFVNMG